MILKNKSIVLLIFFQLFIFFVGCDNSDNFGEIETKENIYQKDFKYLVEKLYEIHPSLTPNKYKYINLERFNNKVNEIYYQLDDKNMHKEKFIYYSSKLLYLLNDSHTGFSSYLKSGKSLPLVLKWFGNDLYIVTAIKKYKELVNKKIKKIAGISVNIIREKVNKFISGENKYMKHYLNGFFLTKNGILDILGLIDSDNKVKIEYEENKSNKVIFLETGYYNFNDIHLMNEYSPRNIITKRRRDRLYYKQILNYSLMYIQWNRFNYSNTNREEDLNYKHDFKNIFSKIKDNKLKYLVLDLRNNIGGCQFSALQFLSYIKHKDNQNIYSSFILYKPSEDLYQLIIENDPIDIEIKNDKNKLFFYETEELKDILSKEGIINLPKSIIFKSKTIGNIKNPFYMNYPDDNLQFDGELYVIIGNFSTSMASQFSMIIKDNEYGTLIGKPTSCSSISHSKGVKVVLPNTNIEVFISGTLNIRANKEARISEPDAVYPDVYIPTTFEDYLNGVDPCWEYLVENVFKN